MLTWHLSEEELSLVCPELPADCEQDSPHCCLLGTVELTKNDNDDNDNDVYFYSTISTKKPIALYSINNNSKPLHIYKLKINETKYKFKYTLNAKKTKNKTNKQTKNKTKQNKNNKK